MRHEVSSLSLDSRKSSADANARTPNPIDLTSWESPTRTDSSSSMTQIRGVFAAIDSYVSLCGSPTTGKHSGRRDKLKALQRCEVRSGALTRIRSKVNSKHYVRRARTPGRLLHLQMENPSGHAVANLGAPRFCDKSGRSKRRLRASEATLMNGRLAERNDKPRTTDASCCATNRPVGENLHASVRRISGHCAGRGPRPSLPDPPKISRPSCASRCRGIL
jgi:hypothetical protein